MKSKMVFLVAGYALTVSFALSLQFLPPIIPELRTTLRMTAGQAGMLMSSLALFGIVVSSFVGYLTDRWGVRTVGLLGLVLVLMAEAWFAVSTTYAGLLGARLLMGVGAATLSILGAQIITQHFGGTARIGLAMGVMNTGVPMGVLISQLLFAPLAARSGWQAPVWVCCAFTVLVLAAFAAFFPRTTAPRPSSPSLWSSLRHLDRRLWLLGIVWMFWNAGCLILLTFANDLLVTRGLTPRAAGLLAAMLMTFPVLGSPSMGHLLEHRHLHRSGMIAASLGFAVCSVLVGLFEGGIVPLFLGVSFCFALGPTGVFGLAPHILRENETGLGYGVLSALLNVGVLFGPAVGGIVRDATGSYLASFVIGAVLTTIGAGFVLLIRPSAPGRESV
jgi:NNP family nitrate/nitrite transporter-like MFS transporter